MSLTTNDMESRAAQAFATTTDWQSNGGSTNAQVRQATFWDTHRSSFSGELRQATDRFAPVDEEIIDVVHYQAREVQFAGDNGVVDTSSSGRG